MTNSELNAWIDEHVFGVDQGQRRCAYCSHKGAICHGEPCRPLNDLRKKSSEPHETCPYAKPIPPADYCGDWAAFGKLVEWLDSNEYIWDLTREVPRIQIVQLADTMAKVFCGKATTLPLALARAVYEAIK